ncbi:nitrogen permease regulator 2-like protein [Drosophila serrata]|uniref:nitrogen permease regulator 2-like protein n=1 Tax=Drosophila serrata TaxID=7274 RepID=UPI000A1D352B|nr:nitrogen permease regulator 2-like protein [Drosophila serrata]
MHTHTNDAAAITNGHGQVGGSGAGTGGGGGVGVAGGGGGGAGGSTEGKIRCIFLSEFHATAGCKISCQVPDNYISKDVFDAINVYIIPKQHLQRCILTVNAMDVKIVGYPVGIQDQQKYVRNAFLFNLCFVCDSRARSVQYEPVVKKLSEYLIMMEEESCFLSREDDKRRLQNIFETVLRDLNERKVATIVEGDNTIHLKIVMHKPDPPQVKDHMVPLLLANLRDAPLDNWDLTTQQILPYINGINHVARIAAEADVETDLVKSCIQNLVYYGVVQLLPILKYSNVYMTQNLKHLIQSAALSGACRKYVALRPDKTLPSVQRIFQFYASMTHGVTLRAICQRLSPHQNNIDERRMVIFGLQHRFIRCIHKYPVFTGSVPSGRQKMYTGLISFDEICCKTGLSPSTIERDIEKDTNVTVIWK